MEAHYSGKRLKELSVKPIHGEFNTIHLLEIHRYIFQDAYPWAGEIRRVDLEKQGFHFAALQYLQTNLEKTFLALAGEEFLQGLSAEQFAMRAAFYLGEINTMHAFREGSGRAQREFIRELAISAGHKLLWICTQDEMVTASILSHQRGDNTGFAQILRMASQDRP